MFQNKYVKEWDCYYSRIIESWHRACRRKKLFGNTHLKFRRWLEQLTFRDYKLNQDQIAEIMTIFENGKMELEMLAEKFIEEEP